MPTTQFRHSSTRLTMFASFNINRIRITPKHHWMLVGLLMLSACSQSTEAVDTVGEPKTGKLVENTQKTQETDPTGAKIVREKPTVSRKGTGIRVLVNRQPITNYDISRRAAFLRLRRIGGNRTKKATDELIDEKIKLQEAARRNMLASDAVVDKAYADFAKRNRMPISRLGGVLGQSGVTKQHFKEFLRAQISWQRTVGTKLRGNTRNISQSDAIFTLRHKGKAKPETREYRLQQIIFVIPENRRKRLKSARRKEALAFSQAYTGCDGAIAQAKQLRDVVVKMQGRTLEPQLPQEWKDSIIKTAVNKTTRPRETPRGIELIGVCSVRNVSDDKAAQVVTQSQKFENLGKEGNKVSQDYLKELRSKATIVYR